MTKRLPKDLPLRASTAGRVWFHPAAQARPIGAAFLLVAALVAVGAVTSAQPASAVSPVPVTVTIMRIIQPDGSIDPGPFEGPYGDFYAAVTINNLPKQENFASRLNNGFDALTGYVYPAEFTLGTSAWTFTRSVDRDGGPVPVAIEIWENDNCSVPFCTGTSFPSNDDDQADVKPTTGLTLSLDVDPTTGRWSGDVNYPERCVEGDEALHVKVCFELSVDSSNGDADGDGLLDSWERNGFDADGDNTVDVALRGANPARKDLYVELDCFVDDANGNGSLADVVDHSHCPREDAVNDVVLAFANAPVTNLDSTRGVQLHVDVGPLYAGALKNVTGEGNVIGSYGDLGGGGSLIQETGGNKYIDFTSEFFPPDAKTTDFWALKSVNFDSAERELLYRYGIFAHEARRVAGTPDCTAGRADGHPGNDFFVTLGGGLDRDGNGVDDFPCFMWASTQNGRDDDGDGRIDEDPPNAIDEDGDNTCGSACRNAGRDEDGGESVGDREDQAGVFMHELGHGLGLDHGGTDDINFKPNYLSVMNYAFGSCRVPKSPTPAVVPGGCDYSRNAVTLDEANLDECAGIGQGFGPFDWDRDRTLEGATCPPPNTTNVTADINRGSPDGRIDVLTGSNDWARLVYGIDPSIGAFADGFSSPMPPEPDPETMAAATARLSDLTRPVIDVDVSGPATALPGQTVIYETAVDIAGGPALRAGLDVTRPDAGMESFSLGDLVVGSRSVRAVTYTVPRGTCPSTLTASARINFVDLASVPGAATGSTVTTVLDVRRPNVSVSLSPTSLWPPNHKLRTITATVVATDECSPAPTVRLISVISNEPDNGLFDGDAPGDVAGASLGLDDRVFSVRAERSGLGNGRTYTATYSVTDASGNVGMATATVTVPVG